MVLSDTQLARCIEIWRQTQDRAFRLAKEMGTYSGDAGHLADFIADQAVARFIWEARPVIRDLE